MKRILIIALIGFAISGALALAQAPDRLERRVQQLEQTIARMEKRLADLEARSATGDRQGMMGGGGMMGGDRPNEQWRAPAPAR